MFKTITNEYNGFIGSYTIDPKTGECEGKVEFIEDLVTFVAEKESLAQEEFEAAVDDYLKTCKELGREPRIIEDSESQ